MKTLQLVEQPTSEEFIRAWNKAMLEIFGSASKSRKWGCPKAAFLGLCEEGLNKDIPPKSYHYPIKNKEWALQCVKLLNNDRIHSSEALCEQICKYYNLRNRPNAQIDVVFTLWKNNLIIKKNEVKQK